MAGLQRSAISFRRQGSSGLVWDDKFLSDELNQLAQQEEDSSKPQDQEQQEQDKEQMKPARAVGSASTIERSRSNGGGRTFRTGRVSPAIEPPSPRVSACGFCGAFGKKDKNNRRRPFRSSMRRT
ncbi:hypothetical protein NMG60_11002655 [Bertholletia excelsa]